MIANLEPIQIRYDQLILRHWARSIHSSELHPLNKNVHNLRHYMNVHRVKTNNYIKDCPLMIATKMLNKYDQQLSISTAQKLIQQPITSMPKYNLKIFPSNYTVKISAIDPKLINDQQPNFYVDGSCTPNPGKGSYGWFCPKYDNHENLYEIDHYEYPVSINRCELMAIHSNLAFINSNPSTSRVINIYSDSKIALQYIQLTTYPKYQNTKILIESILKLLWIIQYKSPNLIINFIKVKSHSFIMGNERIDKLVRSRSQKIQYNECMYNYISYQVTLTEIHKITNNKWKSLWISKMNPNRNISKHNTKFSLRIHHLIYYGKFNCDQVGILMRLLTDHIELNDYLSRKRIKCPSLDIIPDNPYCERCNEIENVNHFVMHCRNYSIQRYKMLQNLCKINYRFKYPKFRKIQYILFPYLLNGNGMLQQILSWKELLSYSKQTHRLNKLYGINTKYI